MTIKRLLFFLPVLLLLSSAKKQEGIPAELAAKEWVETTFNGMTDEERLGQLFMIRAHSDKGPDHIKSVEAQIKKYHVGGLCFFQGTPEKQAELSNRYQALSKIPLMVAIDGEWGLGMRMKASTISYPRQLMLGAIQDNRLIYDMGREIARQCRRIGIHVNFAPVADINNNSKNPVINTRSFGEDRYNVATKSFMYMKGLQDGGVMACGKHFPGHGDTDVDSHYDLPLIAHGVERLDSIELYPFQVLADQGIQSLMVAHLNIPALDATGNRPTTLSKEVVTGLLKEKMNFQGLVFTDGLEMKAVTKNFPPGVVEAEALLAGNDILLLPDNIDASVKVIKEYIADGKLDMDVLNERVKKVLLAKYNYGLNDYQPLDLKNVRQDLNTQEAKTLRRKLIENALTLVRNKDRVVPLSNLEKASIATLSIGASRKTPFQHSLGRYASMDHYQVGKEISSAYQKVLVNKLKSKDLVIVALHNMDSRASKGFGITKRTKTFLNDLQKETKVLLTIFGNPYSLQYFDDFERVLMAYDENKTTQELAAQAIAGANGIKGRLPVTASEKSTFNTGIMTNKVVRLGYALPESVGLNPEKLAAIDPLMEKVIDTVAAPGGVILIAKDGKVVFHKAYGHHTYKKRRKVKISDLFDLASVTKIAAATISVMKLYDEGKIDINNPLSDYLPELKGTNKESMIIKDMMSHIAGLKSWIPFFEQTVSRRKRPLPDFYKFSSLGGYDTPVALNMYMKSSFKKDIWEQIFDSEMNPTPRYIYSDLGFYLIARLVKEVTKKSIDEYVDETFYKPLGLSTATYNPWETVSKDRILPTEEDRYWRQKKVHGYVHDMGAAMLGGVSGHAGLFANANDLAIIMQMLLNKGYYGGKQYFSPETVKIFTQRHPRSTRRGIGFDMLETDTDRDPNFSTKASLNTFGHLGFTGTAAWADPDHNLLFIFLSNRTYPSMKNRKLYDGNFRPRIQDLIYEAME